MSYFSQRPIADGDKGDIVVSGTGAVWTIDNGVVTAAKTSITGTPTGSKYLQDDFSWQTVAGGGDLLATNNLSELTPTASTARTNLGLGTLATQSGTFSGTSSGTNTGDNAVNTLYSGLVSNATHTGDATGATVLTVVKINGTQLSGLATGILKNTTGTGVPSIAAAGTDYVAPGGALGTPSSGALTNCTFPTLNQSTTGSAATLTTPRNINGVAFNGSSDITVPAAGSTLSDTVTVPKGGTGLTALGTGLQVLRTNAGATAMEWSTPSAGGSGNFGSATLDFGAFPGASDASIAVTGQAGIVAGSKVNAWIFPATTADHSADEHWLESLRVFAGNISAGVGFTIYGRNDNQINEPVVTPRLSRFLGTGQDAGGGKQDRQVYDLGGKGTRIYGTWNIAWQWA